MKFTVEIHQNPRPPLTPDILQQLAAHNERLVQRAIESKEGLAEYLCGVKSTSTWRDEETRRWHKTLASWMPKQALDWWLPWFEIEPTLVAMPLGWWRWRALALVVIRCRRQIVAMGALTIVIGNGYQGHNDFRGVALFYEIRGLVVDPTYRGQGLSRHLINALVAQATKLGSVPTLMATQNPQLQASIARQQSVRPAFPGDRSYRSLACWCPRPPQPLCPECPIRPGNTLWWPTHLPARPAKEQDSLLQER